jgi:hypothetical protein
MTGLVEAIAATSLVGLPGWRLALTSDPAEALLLQVCARRAWQLAFKRDEALANRIAAQLAKAWG